MASIDSAIYLLRGSNPDFTRLADNDMPLPLGPTGGGTADHLYEDFSENLQQFTRRYHHLAGGAHKRGTALVVGYGPSGGGPSDDGYSTDDQDGEDGEDGEVGEDGEDSEDSEDSEDGQDDRDGQDEEGDEGSNILAAVAIREGDNGQDVAYEEGQTS